MLAPVLAIVPQAAPLHPEPETLQAMTMLGFEFGAGVSVVVKAAVAPVVSEVGPESENVKLLVTLTDAEAILAGSASLFAVRVTLGGDGRICGAIKSPLASTVPQAGPEQPAPETVQLTARFGFPEPLTLA